MHQRECQGMIETKVCMPWCTALLFLALAVTVIQGFGIHCPPGMVYCLKAGKCVSKEPDQSDNCPVVASSSSAGISTFPEKQNRRCPPGMVYCLKTSLCVWKDPEPNCDCKCDSWTSWCSWSSTTGPDACKGSASTASSVRSRSSGDGGYGSSFSEDSFSSSSSGFSSSDRSGEAVVEMGCPVLLGPASDGPCVDTCKDDSDCGFEEKCCSALDGCSMCQQVDKFELPLLCPDPVSVHTTWFSDFIKYEITTAVVGNWRKYLRLGLEFSDNNVTFKMFSAQPDTSGKHNEWAEVDQERGVAPDARLRLKFPDTPPPGGVYSAMMLLMNTRDQVLRRYPVNFLHFPPNKKPVIRLKTNTPASIDEDSEYGVAPLSSFVEITDPMPEDTFSEDYFETSKRKTLQDCRDAYNWYMSLMTPVRQPSVYVVPTPIPVRVSDVTSKLKVISNEERRKRAATEEDTRFLSSLGGAVFIDESLTVVPKPDWSGTLRFNLYPMDGTTNHDIKSLIKETWRLTTLIERKHLLENSPHVGNKVEVALEVKSVNDPPELNADFLSRLRLGRTDLETDVPPAHVSHDLSENRGFPASALIKKYFTDKDDDSLGLAMVLAESNEGKYQYKDSHNSQWNDLDLSTTDKIRDFLDPDNVLNTWKMLHKDDSLWESFEEGCRDADNRTDVLLLPPGAWIRFQPQNDDWDDESHFAFTAYDTQSIQHITQVNWPLQKTVCVPICLDQAVCGNTGPLSRFIVPGLMQREGCDGDPGSGNKMDACEVCGGDGQTCTYDCNNDLNGKAYDVCGRCAGGKTGLPLDEGKDCRGICGGPHILKDVKLFNKSDSAATHHTRKMCLRQDVDPEEVVTEKFCDGYLGSPARLDKCGECYGGHSGRVANSTLDVCSVCSGDGTSCEDCAGVTNGESSMDTCGVCLLSTDTQRDTGCMKLGQFSEKMVKAGGRQGKVVYVGGANLQNLNLIDRCELVLYSGDTEATPRRTIVLESTAEWVSRENFKRFLKFVTPVSTDENPIETGSYKLACTFSGNGNSETLVSTGSLILYGDVILTKITPDTFNIGHVTSGKVAVGGKISKTLVVYLKCPTDWTVYAIPDCLKNPENLPGSDLNFVKLPVKLDLADGELSDRDFTLPLTPLASEKMTVGMTVEIVAFFDLPVLPEDVQMAKPLTIQIQGRVPSVTRLGFTRTLCGLWIRFDMNIQAGGEMSCQRGQTATVLQRCCRVIFNTETFAKFGTGAQCFTDASKVEVKLAEDHGMAVGETVQLKTRGIQQRGVRDSMVVYADHSQIHSLPEIQVVPTLEVFAPAVVGACSAISLDIKAGGALGCWPSRIQYRVSLRLAHPENITLPDDEHVVRKIGDVKNQQEMITDKSSRQILPDQLAEGWGYIFLVSIINAMGTPSEEVEVTVKKDTEEKPASFFLFGRRKIKPTDMMFIQAVVRATDCYKSRITGYTYTYGMENFGGADMSRFENMRKFHVSICYENSLCFFRGGMEYKIKGQVLIELKTGEIVPMEARLSVYVEEVPIQVHIEPLNERMSQTEPIVLDASKSIDYSNPDQSYLFTWDCEVLESTNADRTCYGNWKGENDVVISSILLGYDAEVVIPANSLNTGKYLFTLTVFSLSRNASTSISIDIVDEELPKVEIEAPELVNPRKLLRIKAEVCSGAPTNMVWRSVESKGLNHLDLPSLCKTKLKRYKPATLQCVRFPLICKGLDMGSVYKFELRAENLNTKSHQVTTAEVKTASTPEINQISITPESGVALETMFTITVGALNEDPLLYTFSFVREKEELKLSSKEAVSSIQIPLPAGEGHILVEACSSVTGMCSKSKSVPISVTPKRVVDMDVDDVEELLDGEENPLSFLRVLESDVDLDNGLDREGETISPELLSYLNDKIMSLAVEELLKLTVDNLEIAISSIQFIIQIIPDVDLQDDLVTVLKHIISTFSVLKSSDEDTGDRRKRSVEDASVPQGSMELITSLLQVHHVMARGTPDADLDPVSAQLYIDDIQNYMVALCNGMVYGEDMATVISEIGCIGSEYRSFSDVHNQSFSTGNCSSVGISPASVILGQEIKNTYTAWECAKAEQCEGTCVATYNSPRDTFTVTSTAVVPLLSTRWSDVVHVRLVNPKTGTSVPVGDLTSPVAFVLQLQGDVNLTDHSLVCRQFVSGDWIEDTCTVTSDVTSYSTEVVCECRKLEPTAVFESDPTTDSNQAAAQPTDSISQTTETEVRDQSTPTNQDSPIDIPSSAVSVLTGFSFTADYSDAIGTGEEMIAFIINLTSQLADVMNVDTGRITDVHIANGQDVSFILLSVQSEETSLAEALNTLRQEVISGNFQIMDQAMNMSVEADSFVASPVTTMAPPDTTKTAEASDNLPLIIGCIVGGVLFGVIIVLVVVIFWMKTKAKLPKSVSPEPLVHDKYSDPWYIPANVLVSSPPPSYEDLMNEQSNLSRNSRSASIGHPSDYDCMPTV